MMERFHLEGKVAIVTGASQGLGEGMALGLAKAGADVIIADIQEKGMEVTEKVRALERKSSFVQLDVSDEKQVETLIDTVIDEYGRIDILINNVGIRNRDSLFNLTEENWDRTLNVNLKSVFLVSKFAAKEMAKRNHGKIINLSSIWHNHVFPERGAYSATKAAVSQLTRVMAKEWAPYGINVNAIAPGIIITPGNEDIRNDEKVKNEHLPNISFGRFGTIEDIEGAAVFLTSPASDFITGQIIHVDGGYL